MVVLVNDLDDVRRRLDSLVKLRLEDSLNTVLQEEYRVLCERERKLLAVKRVAPPGLARHLTAMRTGP
jgi:hypothetical protein